MKLKFEVQKRLKSLVVFKNVRKIVILIIIILSYIFINNKYSDDVVKKEFLITLKQLNVIINTNPAPKIKRGFFGNTYDYYFIDKNGKKISLRYYIGIFTKQEVHKLIE
jgi:hypothetical protein